MGKNVTDTRRKGYKMHIIAQTSRNNQITPLRIYIMNKMNNAIIATIFVAMIMATGMTTAYVFAPSPAVLYEPVEGENPTQGL